MWTIKFLVLLLGVLVGTAVDAPAQCPPPRQGCENAAFLAMNTTVILSTGCIVEVSYLIRECEAFCEIYVDGIVATYTADGCEQCDPVLAGTPLKQVIDEALRWILSRNRGTVPCGPVVNEPMRISNAICWQHAVVAGRRTYIPCGGCCSMRVQVATNANYTVVTYLALDPDPTVPPFLANPQPCSPSQPPACAVEYPCPPPNTGPTNWLFGIHQY